MFLAHCDQEIWAKHTFCIRSIHNLGKLGQIDSRLLKLINRFIVDIYTDFKVFKSCR